MSRCPLLILLLFVTVINCTAQQKYAPKYRRGWDAVHQTILSRWPSEVSTSKQLPYSYITAWPKLPFMFYWDTYFANLGLHADGLDTMALHNTQNILFAVNKYGYMGNAIVTDWGMGRSQPPFLSAMVRDCYENNGKSDTAFLALAYQTLKKEYHFWTDASPKALEQHNTSIKGLQRYSQHASDAELLALFGQLKNRFHFDDAITDAAKINTARPFAAEAETGMDFTPRFEGRCPDFIALDLNCLLYVYERNFAWMVSVLKLNGEPGWQQLARHRKTLINKYCWDEERGLYLDYDYVNKRHSKIASAITYIALWAGVADHRQAERLRKNLRLFETPWGLVTTTAGPGRIKYQWGATSVWPPVQSLAVQGLNKYGLTTDARRITAEYLDLVTKNYLSPIPAAYVKDGQVIQRKKGITYEKYKADGTLNDDEYPASEMMSWTAATFSWCYKWYNNNLKRTH